LRVRRGCGRFRAGARRSARGVTVGVATIVPTTLAERAQSSP
jgi:hypothetical protein